MEKFAIIQLCNVPPNSHCWKEGFSNMKKGIAVFFCLLFLFFSVACVSVVAEETTAVESVPSTDVDPWVEVVSEVVGPQLTGHEEEVNDGIQKTTGFLGKLSEFAAKIRDAFNDFIKKLDALFDRLF